MSSYSRTVCSRHILGAIQCRRLSWQLFATSQWPEDSGALEPLPEGVSLTAHSLNLCLRDTRRSTVDLWVGGAPMGATLKPEVQDLWPRTGGRLVSYS